MWLIQRGLAGSTMLAAMLSGDCANLQGIASCQVRHWRRVLAAVHVLKESSKTGRDALLRASSPGAVAPLTTRCSACVESVADVRWRWATSSQQCRRQPSQAACTRCIGIVDSSCSACDLCTQFLLCQARRRAPARPLRAAPGLCRAQPRPRRMAPKCEPRIRHCELVAAGRIGAALFHLTWSIHAAGDCDTRARIAPASLGSKAGRRPAWPHPIQSNPIRPAHAARARRITD